MKRRKKVFMSRIRVEEQNIQNALKILNHQGFILRRVYRIPYKPQDIFGADILASKSEILKFIQVTTRQFSSEKAEKMRIPMPRCCEKEIWVWKDKKNLFYVYDLEGEKIREEKYEGE